jgi:hypothetical protein
MRGLIAGYTVVTNPELANALADYATVMYREYFDPNNTYKTSWLDRLTEKQAYDVGYDFYYDKHYASTQAAKKAHYIKMVNECGWHPLDYAFWLGAMAAAEKDGRRLAIFGDSSGTPEVEQWVTRIPALRHAMAYNHVVTLNQYGRTNPDGSDADYPVSDDEGYSYFGGRHIRLYDAVPGDCHPLIIVGETGASRSTVTQPFAVEDAIKYSKKLAQGKYGDRIIYTSLYTLGNWMNNNLIGQMGLMEQRLREYSLR